MNNLYFPICAVLINILIVVVFFSKKRIHSDETRAYSNLIIIALLESSLACLLVVLMNLYGIPKYIYNIHRIDYILILFLVIVLAFNIFRISRLVLFLFFDFIKPTNPETIGAAILVPSKI